MKNTHLKHALISAGIAVLAGVLLLGVNAAIGASTPSQQPPGTGVAPTFTGLDVQGDIVNTNQTYHSDTVSINDTVDVTGDLNVDGNTGIGGNLNIVGDIGNVGNIYTKPQGANLYLHGFIASATTEDNEPLVINDDLDVDNDLTVANDTNLNGNFNVTGNATFEGSADIQGVIQNNSTSPLAFSLIEIPIPPPRPVKIDDNLVVTGTSDLQGSISDSTGSLNINDDLDVTGNITNSSTQIDPKTGVSYANPVKIAANVKVTGNVTATGGVSGNVLSGSQLVIYGPATATRFGTYRYDKSDPVSISAGANGTASKACNNGEVLVNCGIRVTTTGGALRNDFDVGAIYPWESNQTCYVRGNNNTDFTRDISARVICLDPDL